MAETHTPEPQPPAATPPRETVAAALRAGLTPLLHALAGTPPRPVRLMRGPGLDKSLASRLVQAARAESDTDFLHKVPSPTGLRILLEKARGLVDAGLLRDAAGAIEGFEALLDTLPGGRQALDAQLGERSGGIRERREQMARQASFKAQSFLFGHFCETLTTALFVTPSHEAGRVDVIEVHRRLGLRRLAASTALPLLSVHTGGAGDGPRMTDLTGNALADSAGDFLVEGACSRPLPDLQVVREGATTTFVLRPGEQVPVPARLTTAWRVLRAERVAQTRPYNILRNYMLHTPCQTLVRDIFVADGLWPDASPQVGFYLPGPSGTPQVLIEPGQPHLRRVNLTARIEQLPPGPAGFELDGVADQRAALHEALARAQIDPASFRGWRCRMAYPVPLIEMQLALRFARRK
jgi:hypothetical protein